ncbi:uncharacterized protein LOC9658011 [Selaginella moellendorffii]|uniref:uncharacterized protein LOC9658011 n=1 Tax=Selaginella moellendorffii TaxID=88036 RepID=UPI000D1CA5EE|nr:uncharacterized protein LOC9658011 [Selaginella moellendorffii]|eukprot:XP_024534947.1 uncharacterized protein LOC9658011 [Selaginella moellendorffii]
MKSVSFLLVLAVISSVCNAQDVSFKATTPKITKGKPNTFIGTTGDQIATSLLASKTPALLWGSVPASAITKICQMIVKTGRLQYTAKVSGDWGGTENLKLKVVATGGCGAAPDSSGTQFVFTDNYGRKSAIVCPNNAKKSGCGVYMTGSDVDRLYKKRLELEQHLSLTNSSGDHQAARRFLLGDCKEEAGKGAIGGAITGVLGVGGCLGLGPLAPFCVVGVLGVSAQLGAAAGCVSACFPGDATVQTSTGETKMMSQLQIGDKVGTLKNGRLEFSEIYAFGHRDLEQKSDFVNLELSHSKTLELSRLHFVPTLLKAGGVEFKRAQDVLVGDVLTASSPTNNSIMTPFPVTRISIVTKPGLYNPLTLQGTIVVNGVAASVHSEWFLDALFDALGLTVYLPAAYQAILSPARLLYTLLGHDSYLALYKWIDARINVAEFGTENGGKIAAAALLASGIASLRLTKKTRNFA